METSYKELFLRYSYRNNSLFFFIFNKYLKYFLFDNRKIIFKQQ